MDDPWELGEAYELFMGRWSRPVAASFLSWLAQPPNGRWLDVGCGTGALSETIGVMAAPRQVTGLDFSAGFIQLAQQRLPDARYHFQPGNALELPFDAGSFDTVVSGLALNFFPKPETAVAEMVRVVVPGGTVAVYVWDYEADMQMLRLFWDAALALDPKAAVFDESQRFPICQPGPLQTTFTAAGLQAVQIQSLDTIANFQNFDDYWQPFLGQNGPAPGYVASLPPAQQTALANHLRQHLPIQPNGTIPLKMRAWAVRGTAGN